MPPRWRSRRRHLLVGVGEEGDRSNRCLCLHLLVDKTRLVRHLPDDDAVCRLGLKLLLGRIVLRSNPCLLGRLNPCGLLLPYPCLLRRRLVPPFLRRRLRLRAMHFVHLLDLLRPRHFDDVGALAEHGVTDVCRLRHLYFCGRLRFHRLHFAADLRPPLWCELGTGGGEAVRHGRGGGGWARQRWMWNRRER